MLFLWEKTLEEDLDLQEINKMKRLFKRNRVDKMSFLESYNLVGLPVITFEANGKKFNFILDSGATGCSIDKSVLENIETGNPIYHQEQYGLGSNFGKLPCYRLKFLYKDKEYEGDFLAGDYSSHYDMIKKEFGVTIHGIIGTDFFKKHQYVIDFAEMVAYSKK